MGEPAIAIAPAYTETAVDLVRAARLAALNFLPARAYVRGLVVECILSGQPTPYPLQGYAARMIEERIDPAMNTNADRYLAALEVLQLQDGLTERRGKRASILHTVAERYGLEPTTIRRDARTVQDLEDPALTPAPRSA